MKLALVAILALPLCLLPARLVQADGTLPPQPYHYLHPPAALAGTNSLPDPGDALVRTTSGHSVGSFIAFTLDGQAGIQAPAGAVVAPPLAARVQLQIRAVETPSGLPAGLTADGNAYSFSAIGRPTGLEADVVQSLGLALRWPHSPAAIYFYAGSSWRQVCGPADWVLTAPTVFCHVSSLGTYLAVSPSAGAMGTLASRRLQPSTPNAPNLPYVPFVAVATCLYAVRWLRQNAG